MIIHYVKQFEKGTLCSPKNKVVMGRRVGSKNLSKELKNKNCDVSKAVHVPTYIAHFYKLSRNSVQAVIGCKKLQMSKVFKKKAGRKHKLGPICLRRLLNHVRSKVKQPLFVIVTSFRTKDGVKISEGPIRCYVHSSSIKSSISASKLYLKTKHVAARLNWCVIRQQWSINQ